MVTKFSAFCASLLAESVDRSKALKGLAAFAAGKDSDYGNVYYHKEKDAVLLSAGDSTEYANEWCDKAKALGFAQVDAEGEYTPRKGTGYVLVAESNGTMRMEELRKLAAYASKNDPDCGLLYFKDGAKELFLVRGDAADDDYVDHVRSEARQYGYSLEVGDESFPDESIWTRVENTRSVSEATSSFTTSKGSVYTYLPDGRTQRFKKATGEQNEPQDLTVFVNFTDDAQAQRFLQAVHGIGPNRIAVFGSNGGTAGYNRQVAGKKASLCLVDKKGSGIVEKAPHTSTVPVVGMHPFDQRVYTDAEGLTFMKQHIGNKITEIKDDKGAAGPEPSSVRKAVSSFTTAKGSVYTYLPDGRTQRFKKATGEQNEPQDLTIFVKFKDHQQNQDYLRSVHRITSYKVLVMDDKYNVYNTNSEVAGKQVYLVLADVQTSKVLQTVPASTQPMLGWNTYDQRRFTAANGDQMAQRHIGNVVTAINESMQRNNVMAVEDVWRFIDYQDSNHDLFPGYSREPLGEDEEYRFSSREAAVIAVQDLLDEYAGMPAIVQVYRTVKVERLEDVRTDDPGESWSSSRQAALNFANNHARGNVLLSGSVRHVDIDWEASARLHFEFSGGYDGYDEEELVVPYGTEVRDLKTEWINSAKTGKRNTK